MGVSSPRPASRPASRALSNFTDFLRPPPPRPRPALRPPSSLLPRPRVDMAAARSRDLPRGPHFFPPPSTTGMPPRAARPTRRPFASASPSSAACPSAPRGQPSLGIAVDAFAEQSTLPITCRCELAGRSSELRTCEHEARLARLAARDDRRRRLCSLRLRRRRLRLRSCCRRCSLLLLVVVHDCTARASLDCLRRRHHRVDRHRFRVCA